MHTHMSMKHISTRLLRHKQTSLHTHTHTQSSFFSEWSMFSVQSSLFDTEPFCTRSRACAEYVEEEGANTHKHTPCNMHPLTVIGPDGLGVKAVVQ